MALFRPCFDSAMEQFCKRNCDLISSYELKGKGEGGGGGGLHEKGGWNGKYSHHDITLSLNGRGG